MIKDILFVVMVLSVSIYAHSNRSKIIDFIEVQEEEQEEQHAEHVVATWKY